MQDREKFFFIVLPIFVLIGLFVWLMTWKTALAEPVPHWVLIMQAVSALVVFLSLAYAAFGVIGFCVGSVQIVNNYPNNMPSFGSPLTDIIIMCVLITAWGVYTGYTLITEYRCSTGATRIIEIKATLETEENN